MNVRRKTLITVLLVVAVVGIMIFQTQNRAIFKGQLFGDGAGDNTARDGAENSSESDGLLPDLRVELKAVSPEEEGGDLAADVTIVNNGPGIIDGNTPFKYTVFLNDLEVFSNVDSYTTMSPGDSFNFTYPISQLIYQYPDEGILRVGVDLNDAIDEFDEDNNEAEVNYSL